MYLAGIPLELSSIIRGVFVVFLISSMRMLGLILEIGYGHLLPRS
jgi:hypothetical protein